MLHGIIGFTQRQAANNLDDLDRGDLRPSKFTNTQENGLVVGAVGGGVLRLFR